MCGLCLPHCPTYLKTRDEGESPRGRIALMQGLTSGRLELSARLEAHLDHCLGCRACEAACPSGVPYGELIDAVRADIEARRVRPLRQRVARNLLAGIVLDKRLGQVLGVLLHVYRGSGLQRLLRWTGLLSRFGLASLDRLVNPFPVPHSWKPYYPPKTEERGQIALFTGCVANAVDQATLRATVNVLTRLGIGVHVPSSQACCGALHLHAGKPEEARALARRNLAAFVPLHVDAVLFAASSCGAQLTEYPMLLDEDGPAAQFSSAVKDAIPFLNSLEWPEHVQLAPLPARVAVHEPCSVTHVLRRPGQAQALLSRIPDIELVPLPENSRCCGAAGSYMITQPEMAQALLADKLAHLGRVAPAILATSNLGCALHLLAGIREAGLDIEVVHPIALIERQMVDNT